MKPQVDACTVPFSKEMSLNHNNERCELAVNASVTCVRAQGVQFDVSGVSITEYRN